MASTIAQWRAVKRTSFTKGVGPVAGVFDSFALFISNLEVNERAPTSGEEAQVKDHGHSHPHPDKTRPQYSTKRRFIEVLVQPDHRNQKQHQDWNLRVLPGCAKNPTNDENRVAQGFRPEENPSKADEQEDRHLFDQAWDFFAIKCQSLELPGHHDPRRVQSPPDH